MLVPTSNHFVPFFLHLNSLYTTFQVNLCSSRHFFSSHKLWWWCLGNLFLMTQGYKFNYKLNIELIPVHLNYQFVPLLMDPNDLNLFLYVFLWSSRHFSNSHWSWRARLFLKSGGRFTCQKNIFQNWTTAENLLRNLNLKIQEMLLQVLWGC